jgi:hypothetical protein
MYSTKFDIRTTGSPVNKFRREVPVNRTVRLTEKESITLLKLNNFNQVTQNYFSDVIERIVL